MLLKSPKDNLYYSDFYLFSAAGIMKAPYHSVGIYTIYAHRNCLYVGKTENQSLQKRLFDHYRDCHNFKLKKWILSDIRLRFRFVIVEDVSLIDRIEKRLINELSPVCNIRR